MRHCIVYYIKPSLGRQYASLWIIKSTSLSVYNHLVNTGRRFI